jgi:hypothetical protein
MSYCRWSSDDFGCDVYVYEDVSGGWTTHVARFKVLGEIPKIPPMTGDPAWPELFLPAYNAQMAYLETAQRAPIDLAHDGESFNDPTPGQCAERLQWLCELGYKVPQYAIDELREEQEAEHDNQP